MERTGTRKHFAQICLVSLVVALTTATGPWVGTVEASAHAVHPGDQMEASGGFCTVNFVFEGIGDYGGDVYFGTAAHCVSTIGQSVDIGGTSGFATVAYIQDEEEAVDDFAFLIVDPQHEHRVRATVRGHPGTPVGHTTSLETSPTDLLLFSGHGVGFGFSPITREGRFGTLWSDNGEEYKAHGPILPGDSGGPIIHEETGKAFGIQTRIVAGCCQGPGTWISGPTVEGMLARAAANGFTVELRTG